MSDYSSEKHCGYTEDEIRRRAANTRTVPWTVGCVNDRAHYHDDKNASAYDYPENRCYGYHVCGLEGFAKDRYEEFVTRKRSDRTRNSCTQSKAGAPPKDAPTTQKKSERARSESKRLKGGIPSEATLIATYPYKQFDGAFVHQVLRYEWNDETGERCKTFRLQYFDGKRGWSMGDGEKVHQLLVRDCAFSHDQAAGVMIAANETAIVVLDEMKRFEERVNVQFKEFRSDVDKQFDEVKQQFAEVKQQFAEVKQEIADVRSDFRMQKWTLWATFAGVVLTCVVTLFAGA